jgi:methylenetetrahydrofolate reductase (NADPH)
MDRILEKRVENHLRSDLQNEDFFCSAELVLDRDHTVPEAEKFVRDAAKEPAGIKVISLTDLPGGNPSLPPEAFASFVVENGLTPLAHLTGKDGNRSFVEGRLHALARIGVENILALTGDAQKSAFLGKAKPVFDLDSVLMLWLIRALREGLQYNVGNREVRTSPFDFFPGVVVNPYKASEPDQMMQFYKLELKIAVGAKFIITQLGFNLRKLFELKQYMLRQKLDHIPVIANIYVPTATIAKMMKAGEVAGCIISDDFIRRLEGGKKPERLERAALMLAAVRNLGFAGGHIGGFGLNHADFMKIVGRSLEIGQDWKRRMEELTFETPGEFYLLPQGTDGLSEPAGEYQLSTAQQHLSVLQRFSMSVHRIMIDPESFGARFLNARLERERDPKGGVAPGKGLWHSAIGISSLYRKATLGCMSCGDCIQDHLLYAGCSMRWCYKNLRNGPCGGSRQDGSCEADPSLPCIWNLVYSSAVASGDDPARFGRILIPPRDWCLDQTNALANRLVGLDNYCRRVSVGKTGDSPLEPA